MTHYLWENTYLGYCFDQKSCSDLRTVCRRRTHRGVRPLGSVVAETGSGPLVKSLAKSMSDCLNCVVQSPVEGNTFDVLDGELRLQIVELTITSQIPLVTR